MAGLAVAAGRECLRGEGCLVAFLGCVLRTSLELEGGEGYWLRFRLRSYKFGTSTVTVPSFLHEQSLPQPLVLKISLGS